MEIAYIDSKVLEDFMRDAFIGVGVPDTDAAICADVLITADRRGIDTHGIGRFKSIYYDRIREGILTPVTLIESIKETETTAVLDGHDGMGHVIAKRAMEMAIEKASLHGMGMVAARRSSHYGIAGYYALMAADRGMIGITGTNARPSIAPTFGVENMPSDVKWHVQRRQYIDLPASNNVTLFHQRACLPNGENKNEDNTRKNKQKYPLYQFPGLPWSRIWDNPYKETLCWLIKEINR